MREKSLKVVVTFSTTSDAMAAETAARLHGLPGRIIPVPSEIDAGCGLAWAADASKRDQLEAGLKNYALVFEGLFEVMMY